MLVELKSELEGRETPKSRLPCVSIDDYRAWSENSVLYSGVGPHFRATCLSYSSGNSHSNCSSRDTGLKLHATQTWGLGIVNV